MATDLCKTDLGTGSGAARYPLLADGKDLLIVKHPKAWLGTGGGKNMIVTLASRRMGRTGFFQRGL